MRPIIGQSRDIQYMLLLGQYGTTYYVAMPHTVHGIKRAAMQPTVGDMSCHAEPAREHSVTSGAD